MAGIDRTQCADGRKEDSPQEDPIDDAVAARGPTDEKNQVREDNPHDKESRQHDKQAH